MFLVRFSFVCFFGVFVLTTVKRNAHVVVVVVIVFLPLFGVRTRHNTTAATSDVIFTYINPRAQQYHVMIMDGSARERGTR